MIGTSKYIENQQLDIHQSIHFEPKLRNKFQNSVIWTCIQTVITAINKKKKNLKKLIQSFLFFYSVVFLALKTVEKIKTHQKSSALQKKKTIARTIHDPSTNYQELILVTNEPEKDSQKRKKGAKIVTFFSPQMILNYAFW